MSAIDDVRAGRTEIRWGERISVSAMFYEKGYVVEMKERAFSIDYYADGDIRLMTSSYFDYEFKEHQDLFKSFKYGKTFPTEEEAKAYAQKFYDRFVVEIEARQKEGAGR